jgi:hypothetical protein
MPLSAFVVIQIVGLTTKEHEGLHKGAQRTQISGIVEQLTTIIDVTDIVKNN